MTAKFEYAQMKDGNTEDLITESEVPDGWNEIVIGSYSQIGSHYKEASEAEPGNLACNLAVDDLVAELIRKRGFSEILEIGTGDGNRLLNIRQNVGRSLHMQGTELDDALIAAAQRNSVEAIKHDMRQPLPHPEGTLDLILYLNNAFSFVMDRNNGKQMRVEALKSAYKALKPKGMLVLDLLSQDNEHYDRSGRVSHFERILLIDDKPQTGPLPFWSKKFRLREVGQLLAAAGLSNCKISIKYMVRRDYNGNTTDTSRSGTIVHQPEKFEGPEVEALLAHIAERYRAGTDYRMIVTVEKPK